MESSPVRRLRASLTTGNLWLAVLSSLSRSEQYAWGMRETIEKRFGWKPGLVLTYIVLYKLEGEGLISSKFKGRRKYYAITPAGRKALREGKRLLQHVAGRI